MPPPPPAGTRPPPSGSPDARSAPRTRRPLLSGGGGGGRTGCPSAHARRGRHFGGAGSYPAGAAAELAGPGSEAAASGCSLQRWLTSRCRGSSGSSRRCWRARRLEHLPPFNPLPRRAAATLPCVCVCERVSVGSGGRCGRPAGLRGDPASPSAPPPRAGGGPVPRPRGGEWRFPGRRDPPAAGRGGGGGGPRSPSPSGQREPPAERGGERGRRAGPRKCSGGGGGRGPRRLGRQAPGGGRRRRPRRAAGARERAAGPEGAGRGGACPARGSRGPRPAPSRGPPQARGRAHASLRRGEASPSGPGGDEANRWGWGGGDVISHVPFKSPLRSAGAWGRECGFIYYFFQRVAGKPLFI